MSADPRPLSLQHPTEAPTFEPTAEPTAAPTDVSDGTDDTPQLGC
jgi:hypothetical protein